MLAWKTILVLTVTCTTSGSSTPRLTSECPVYHWRYIFVIWEKNFVSLTWFQAYLNNLITECQFSYEKLKCMVPVDRRRTVVKLRMKGNVFVGWMSNCVKKNLSFLVCQFLKPFSFFSRLSEQNTKAPNSSRSVPFQN